MTLPLLHQTFRRPFTDASPLSGTHKVLSAGQPIFTGVKPCHSSMSSLRPDRLLDAIHDRYSSLHVFLRAVPCRHHRLIGMVSSVFVDSFGLSRTRLVIILQAGNCGSRFLSSLIIFGSAAQRDGDWRSTTASIRKVSNSSASAWPTACSFTMNSCEVNAPTVSKNEVITITNRNPPINTFTLFIAAAFLQERDRPTLVPPLASATTHSVLKLCMVKIRNLRVYSERPTYSSLTIPAELPTSDNCSWLRFAEVHLVGDRGP